MTAVTQNPPPSGSAPAHRSARLLLVDAHDRSRHSTRLLLEAVPGWQVIGETDDHDEALALARHRSPDVVLIGMRVRDGSSLRTTEALVGLTPSCPVVVLSLFDSPEYVEAALKAGALGYVLKQSTSEDLVAAIQAAREGRRHLGQGVHAAASARP